MKTIQEMIKVMQAYLDGKRIEACRLQDPKGWFECPLPKWDWYGCDYRVKEKEYVPFDSSLEFLVAQMDHGEIIRRKIDSFLFHSFVNKDKDVILLYNDDLVIRKKMDEIYDKYEFADGTPCGKEVNL